MFANVDCCYCVSNRFYEIDSRNGADPDIVEHMPEKSIHQIVIAVREFPAHPNAIDEVCAMGS